ncbi:MAG: hypothetical protein II139_10740, partial [Lachnospiraceae bacterium]|nr:hypothetical protein [Lachnospiraceae bacterium]
MDCQSAIQIQLRLTVFPPTYFSTLNIVDGMQEGKQIARTFFTSFRIERSGPFVGNLTNGSVYDQKMRDHDIFSVRYHGLIC